MDARLDDGWEAIDDLDPMMGGGWWDDHNRGLMDLHQLRNVEKVLELHLYHKLWSISTIYSTNKRDLFGDDQDMGVFHGFDHHMAGNYFVPAKIQRLTQAVQVKMNGMIMHTFNDNVFNRLHPKFRPLYFRNRSRHTQQLHFRWWNIKGIDTAISISITLYSYHLN